MKIYFKYYFILRLFFIFTFLFILSRCAIASSQNARQYPGKGYQTFKDDLAVGWNAWNTISVISHVLLPQCFALNLHLHNAQSGRTLENTLISRQGNKALIEKIAQGNRTYDGSYTDLII